MPGLLSEYDMSLEHAYNVLRAPDIPSAIASFTGYIQNYYPELYNKFDGPGGHEAELVINGDTYGKVTGVNDSGLSFIIDTGDAEEAEVEEVWGEEDDFLDDWEDDD